MRRTIATLLQELLERFAAEYAAAKRRESAVDFEDLQLAARDLLRDDERVRDSVRLRFRMVMVDEFQDTNRLQCELVDLVSHPEETEIFTVGDEFQSIYGFRHADVEVFRERRARAAQLLTLRSNYRSRPQVLAAVNYLFAGAFGDEYQPLAASAEFADPVFGHPVELLVTDKSSYRDAPEHWRIGEARAIAARVRELVDSGEALPGEIVVLFAAGTDAERYEEALRREGLPTFRATGRGYFGQQQVVDLLAYLRLLHNRYDDVALATVLASPFVGVSNDTLVLIRRNAQRRPLFTALEKGIEAGLSDIDARLLRAFRQRYERLVRLRRASASSGSASRSSPSTTTTSRCSRAGTARGGSRTCASSAASRGSTRRSAGAISPGSSASCASRTRSGRRSSRRLPRRRAPTPCACSRSTRRRGSSSRS